MSSRTIRRATFTNVTFDQVRGLCGLAMLVAAGMHVEVGLGHAGSNFGAMSLAASVAQGVLGVLVLTRRSPAVFYAIILVNLMLVQMYIVNVTVGLPPLIAHTHVPGTHQLWGVTLAMPGPFEWQGVFAKTSELIGVASAAICIRATGTRFVG